MILAVRTFQRASCEKDGPRAILAGDRGFLAKMRTDMSNPELMCFTAITDLCISAISNPVDAALARAKNAIFIRFYQTHPDGWL